MFQQLIFIILHLIMYLVKWELRFYHSATDFKLSSRPKFQVDMTELFFILNVVSILAEKKKFSIASVLKGFFVVVL